MNVARSTLTVFLGRLLENLVKFLGIVFFARVLGPDRLGTFFLFLVSATILTSFGDLDVSRALEKRISEHESSHRKDLFATAVALKLPLIGTLFLAIIILRSPINSFLGEKLALLLAVQVLVGHFKILLMNTLKGELRVGETALPSLGETIVYIGVGGLLVTAGYGVFGVVWAYILSTVVMVIWNGYLISVGLGRPSRECARSLFDYFKYSFITSAGYKLFSWTDVLLVGVFLSQTSVGIYEVPWRVTAPVLILGTAFTNSMFPQVSSLSVNGEDGEIKNTITGGLAVSMILVIPAFFGVSVLARDILVVGFGTEYLDGLWVLIVIAGVRIFEAVNDIWSRSLQAVNRPQLASRAEVASLGVNLVLNAALILQYGIVGAAIATAIATALKMVLNGWYLGQFVKFSFPARRMGGILIASVVMALLLVIVRTVFAIETVWDLGAIVALGIVAYGGIVLLIRPLRTMIRHNVYRAFHAA